MLASNSDVVKELEQSKVALKEKLSNGETQWKLTESQLIESQGKVREKDAALNEMNVKLQTQVGSTDFSSSYIVLKIIWHWFSE